MKKTDAKKLELEITTDVAAAMKYCIMNTSDLDVANEFLTHIVLLKKKINGTFDPLIAKASDLHKSTIAEKKKYWEPLDKAEKYLKLEIANFLKLVQAAILENVPLKPDMPDDFEETNVIVSTEIPTVKGVSISQRQDFEVIDKIRLMKAVIIGIVPPDVFMENGPAIRSLIKNGMTDIPGVKIFEKDVVKKRI